MIQINSIYHDIQLSFGTSDVKRTTIKQNSEDTHVLRIKLYDKQNNEITIDSNWNINISAIKGDKTHILNTNNISIKDNTAHVTMTKQMLSASGTERCELIIQDRDQTLFSDTFLIYVEPNVQYGSFIESSNECDSIIDTLQHVEEKKDMVDQLTSEIEETKVDIGKTYDELKIAVEETNDLIQENEIIKSNEAERKHNEEIRQSQEAGRQTNTATAISNAEEATVNANNAAERANSATDDLQDKLASHHFVLTEDKDVAGGVPSLDDNAKVPIVELYDATTSNKGVTQLTDSVTSTSITTAATPNSVKIVNDLLNSEINRAKSAESTLTTNLSDEVTRAKDAENTNANAISAETTRATTKENEIANNLSDEITRAKNSEALKAPLANPALTGTPTAPTASSDTNTTQIATTAFVQTAVSNHNDSSTAHTDIRDLISDITTRLNALADSDDTTLDQLSEIVAYIKSNRTLIESITIDKVNVSDIIDNLTSTASDKPLSANQGKVLNDLINALSSVVDTKIDTINGDTYIGTSKSGTAGTITHKDVTRTNTTSTVSPSSGSTFTAVDSVTSDSKGHITGVNTKTVTLPNTSVTVDSALSETSTNPVQNKVVYDALNGKSDTGHTHNYAGSNSAGGNALKLNLPREGNDANWLPDTSSTMQMRELSNNSSNLPEAEFFQVIANRSGDGSYGSQLAMGMTTNNLYFRNFAGAVFGNWRKVAFTDSSLDYATKSKFLDGFTVQTGSSWGEQSGEFVHGEETSDGCAFRFNKNCPSSGKLSMIIDGNFYQNEGNYMCLDTNNYSSYALPLSGGTVTGSLKVNGRLNIGDKVTFWSDNEGGNIRWYSPAGVQWEFDCFDENFRLFNYNSFKDFRITRDKGDVYLPNNLYLGASAPKINLNGMYFYRDGNSNQSTHIYGNSSSYPHLWLRQFSNVFQFFPNTTYASGTKEVHIGHSAYRFGDGYFTNVYNSSGVITTSDRNKKHDIEEISDDFSEKIVDGLIPSSFKFNDGSSGRTHFGIIAQDLEKLLEALGISTTDFAPLVKEYPDKEVEIENPDYDENDENSQKYIKKLEKDYDAEPIYNVRYEEFIMILVKYCQVLKKKDLELEQRMSELEEKVNTLIAG